MRYARREYSDQQSFERPKSPGRCAAIAAMAARKAGVKTVACPRTGESVRALIPPATKRQTHRRAVFAEVPRSIAIALTGRPSLAARTIAARSPKTGSRAMRCNCSRVSAANAMRSGNRPRQLAGRPPVACRICRKRSILIVATTPERTRCARSLYSDHCWNDSPTCAGTFDAISRMRPQRTASKRRGRSWPALPWNRPAIPTNRYRATHRRTVSRCTPNRSAMTVNDAPRARSSTMAARTRCAGEPRASHSCKLSWFANTLVTSSRRDTDCVMAPPPDRCLPATEVPPVSNREGGVAPRRLHRLARLHGQRNGPHGPKWPESR